VKLKQTEGVFTLDCFGPSVLAAFSGRQFGESKRELFLSELGITPEKFIRPKQVHGAAVLTVDPFTNPSIPFEADAIVTTEQGRAVGIITADCVPIFIYDPKTRSAGLVHAGWRGIHAGIIAKTLQSLQKLGVKSNSLQAAFGPAIRVCCYEVGSEFAGFFPRFYSKPAPGKVNGCMNLIAEATAQLIEAGLSPQNIFDSGFCTSCQNHSFFSARKEKTPERILSVIQLI